jgi:hypothetical protein
MTDLLPKALEFGYFDLGWEDAASLDPSEWHYEDIEVFYAFGRCHHLAIAMHRAFVWKIGAIMETDPDWLEEEGLPLPVHVFATPRAGQAFDARGARPVDVVHDEMRGTGSISQGSFRLWDSEQEFVEEIVKRPDSPLKPVSQNDLDRTARLMDSRIWTLGEEHRAAVELWRSAKP